MMSHFTSIALVWVLALCSPLVPQGTKPVIKATGVGSPTKTEQKEPDPSSVEVQQHAITLVRSMLAETTSLGNGTFKVGLQARIGETLWKYDVRIARNAFEDALRTIDAMPSEPDGHLIGPNYDGTFRSQLRREVVEVLARSDSEWAKKIALRDIKIPNGKRNPRLDFHSIMGLSEADPRTAIELLRTNIDVHRDATLLREVLMKIRPKQPALADDAFDYALSLADKNLRQPFSYFFEVFGYVFPDSRHKVEGDAEYSSSLASNPIDESLIRRFLALGFRAIMQEADEIAKESKSVSERSGYGYDYVMGMLPAFQPYMPAEEAKMRARWNNVVGNLRNGTQTIKEWNLLRNPPAVESLLRDAETAKDYESNVYYVLAAHRALSDGQYDRAFSIVGRITDEEDRNKQKTALLPMAAAVALNKGDLEYAYKFAREIDESYQRIKITNRLLNALLDRKDSTSAARILGEALQRTAQDKDLEQVDGFLNLAEIAIRLNPERGFAVTKLGVEALNRGRMSDGTPYIEELGVFDRTLVPLARVDFAKALSLADTLKGENSLSAKLAVCRGVLITAKPARSS